MRWVVAVCGAVFAASAFAQQSEPPSPPPDEPKPEAPAPAAEPPPPPKPKSQLGDPPLHRWGGLTIAADAWSPMQANQDDEIAIFNDTLQNTRVLDMPSDATTREHIRVTYHLPKDMGSIRFEYDSMRHEAFAKIFDPGNFVYGELHVIPFFAGLRDDGLADGLDATSVNKTREFRVEYEATAFESPRAKGTYHVGYHTVDNAWELDTNYYALLPTFPPFLPPNFSPDFNPTFLFPIPDSARSTSDFTGSGLGGGFEVEFKLHPRVSLWGDISLGVLRGNVDTRYASTTSAYFLRDEAGNILLTFEEVLAIIAAEHLPDPDGTNQTELITQGTFTTGVALRNRTRMVYEFDVSMGIDFKIWRSLVGTVGLRELGYVDVTSDVRRGTPVLQPTGTVNLERVEENDKSAGYEGFFIGLSYRF
jgi:hypothetical protein